MKHKKFVKMLMHAGMSRNNANECATLTHNAQRPYFVVLGDLLNHHRAKFQQDHVLDDRRVRTAIIHGTNSRVYGLLYGRITKLYEVSLVPAGGYPLGGGDV